MIRAATIRCNSIRPDADPASGVASLATKLVQLVESPAYQERRRETTAVDPSFVAARLQMLAATGRILEAVLLYRTEHPNVGPSEAIEKIRALSDVRSDDTAGRPEQFATSDELLAKLRDSTESPVAIEAFWDGDTHGWFVMLVAVCGDASASGYRDVHLATLRGAGGDMRFFNDQVPPWPEAQHAALVGREVAERLAVPFYFAAPAYPEDGCPRWWERDAGYPCRVCGLLLLQRQPCPWRGVCYKCHLAERRKEAGSGRGD